MQMPVSIAISSCLFGEPVRYDGNHKRQSWLEQCPAVTWVPVCPEVELGMTVPREPIQIERMDGQLKLVATQSRTDWTQQMKTWAGDRIAQLKAQQIHGYVLKARSPSCGTGGVPIWESEKRSVVGEAQGRFCSRLQSLWSALPIIDEEAMARPEDRERFLQQVRHYASQQISKED